MTGRTHALTGVGGGCLLAGALPGPLPARAVALLLVVVGALAPDIDSRRSVITRGLGPVGWLAHHGAIAGGRAIFRATATEDDEDPWDDGHRLITHTVAGTLAAGMTVAAGTALLGWWLGGNLGAGIVAAWWAWGLAFTWGCLVHVLGDCCTVQGCPLAWPLPIRGRRWYLVVSPVAVHAGGDGEHLVVVPVAWAGTVAAALWMLGLWGPLLSALGWMVGRP